MVTEKLRALTGAADHIEYSPIEIFLIFADATQRLATSSEIISAKRMVMREQINEERERRIALGLSYTFPDATVGTVQMRNQTDFRNINGQTTAALVLKNQSITDPILWFTDAENVKHENMTADHIIAMGMAVQARVAALYVAANAIKTSLESADPDTFDITQGWPA